MTDTIQKFPNNLSRRHFISTTVTACITLNIPAAALPAVKKMKDAVKIGLIADLHQDVMHDGPQRLSAFLDHMKANKPDAIMQMGDFAYPGDKNKVVIDMFNAAHKNRMHVIGNHDTDSGYSKEQCISYWGMPSRYYAQKVGGTWFLVLDGNDKGSPTHKGGYASYINPEQTAWLKAKLKEIQEPVIIVSHQPLAGTMAVDNAAEIQEILSSASDKILLAINGHTHINALLRVKHIPYLHINSASYFWVGDRFMHNSYAEAVHKEYPWISRTCPYKESLFATLTVDPATNNIVIEGKRSEWMGASPAELGYNELDMLTVGEEIAPVISDRNIERARKKV